MRPSTSSPRAQRIRVCSASPLPTAAMADMDVDMDDVTQMMGHADVTDDADDALKAAIARSNAAREAADKAGVEVPWVIAVTILTSMDQDDLDDVGLKGPIEERVVKLAELTRKAGLDGVVCSAQEITPVRKALGPDFKLITPGIRPSWAASDDQKRIVTPADAVAMGSDVLVIGRPITKAEDPSAAFAACCAELLG